MRDVVERTLAGAILLLVSPILAAVGLIILMADGKPVLFTQQRIGLNKKPFTLFKFKTMNKGIITTLGKFLRNTGIDELPQLINILKGDMRFVGPRPLTMEDIKRLKWDDEFHSIRWSVKPGITGLGQLPHKCNAKLTWFYDKYYIKHRSLLLDAKIIIASAAVVVAGKEKMEKIIRK